MLSVRRLFLWALHQGSEDGRVQKIDEALTISDCKFYSLIRTHRPFYGMITLPDKTNNIIKIL